MANFTPRSGIASPKNLYSYKTFTTYSWNHYAPETEGNCTWFAFGETARIVQECLNDESYNIQYTSGNEFMSSGPSALYWISNAYNKGAWTTIGDRRGNYDPRNSSIAGTQINVQPGDILCYWATDGFGHVEVVEQISGNNVYCSGSKAAVSQPAVFYYERVVDISQFKVGTNHTFSGGGITWSGDYFQGIIRNPYVTDGPTPPPTTTPEITITPSSASGTMESDSDYIDFTFNIIITGIPNGESASGGNTYPGLSRVYNSGWSYSDYVVDGVTYRRASKTQTLRYEREFNSNYTTTKYMYFNMTFSNGSINSTTSMYITVRQKKTLIPILFRLFKKKSGSVVVRQI